VAEVIHRQAGRVLVVDAAGRLLLLKGFDPAGSEPPYWFTVGGGAKPGETLAQAAARELGEETGIVASADELGQPIWHEVAEFGFEGRWFRQEQDFFLLKLGAADSDGTDAVLVEAGDLADEEAAVVLGHRWWTLAELESTSDPFYPAELPELLRNHARLNPHN
jgi:8-oxo-dGTP pyrophosphatase MutT (NUDIX family)